MRRYFLITLAIFLLDRLLKILSVNFAGKIFLIPGFAAFDRHINYGIIFSLDFPLWPIKIASVIFMAAILVLMVRSFLSPPLEGGARGGLGWLLVLSGALSNFLDRIIWNGTVDYVNILDTSLVNIADGMILVGIVILVIKLTSENKKPDGHGATI